MALDLGEEEQIFSHSADFSQGGGNERIGAGTFVVSLDGTGDFDDIQEAIDALPSTGGNVFIKEGIYLSHKGIEIKNDNTLIQGVGDATVLQIGEDFNPATTFGFIYTAEKNGVTIKDLKINGSLTGSITTKIQYISVRYSERNLINNVSIDGMYGIGVAILHGNNNIVTNCKFTQISGDLPYMDGVEIASTKCTISNNQIINLGSEGIIAMTFNENIISDNHISGCTNQGIYINASDKNIINANNSSSNDIGIHIVGASDRNIIIGNICLGNTTSQITDAGSNTHPNGASGTNNLALDDLNIIA